MSAISPKQLYELRKAERKKANLTAAERELALVDLVDRFVTAVERIADIMESAAPR